MGFVYDAKRGGVFSPDNRLMPHPGRIFRRQALLDMVRYISDFGSEESKRFPLKGKRYLEIGCGTGLFAYEFYRMGCKVSVYDLSDDILKIADNIFNSDKHRLHILKNLPEGNVGYDIVAAYSVLEHIENDEEMLKYWSTFLRPGGVFVLSVPARMKHWSYVDDVAGHLRRYEKNDLLKLFQDAGMCVEKCVSIGFPFQVLISKLTSAIVWKKRLKELQGLNDREKTALSGTVSELYKYHRILPYKTLVVMAKFQRFFYNTDWGVDYVVVARKNSR